MDLAFHLVFLLILVVTNRAAVTNESNVVSIWTHYHLITSSDHLLRYSLSLTVGSADTAE
jgi:hypothetical protein